MKAINSFVDSQPHSIQPVFFLGHGSPMNLIEKNSYTNFFSGLGKVEGNTPSAIVVVSAHWLTRGTQVLSAQWPRQIFDFYGFPQALYDISYTPSGAPELAKAIADLGANISLNDDWGLDHGAWSLLHHMFPNHDVPVIQLSIDKVLSPIEHLQLARQLKHLRHKGVLFIGSGNIVHNLGLINMDQQAEAATWAIEFEQFVVDTLTSSKSSEQKIKMIYEHSLFKRAHPTLEHLIPLIYSLGLGEDAPEAKSLIRGIQNTSISMASFCWT